MQRVQGRAKINLTLDILGKRQDGFHEVAMVMQSIELADTVCLEKAREPGIHLSVNLPWLRADASNLAWRAAELMYRSYHITTGIEIRRMGLPAVLSQSFRPVPDLPLSRKSLAHCQT